MKALESLGVKRSNIIRTRMLVTDIGKWKEFRAAHGDFFKSCPPVTTMVEVKALIDPALLIEIEADVVVP